MISRTGNEICCDKNQICALRFFWDFICVIPHSCNRIFGCLILDGDFYHLIDPQGKKKIEFCLQCYICRYFYSQMFIQAENFYSAKSFSTKCWRVTIIAGERIIRAGSLHGNLQDDRNLVWRYRWYQSFLLFFVYEFETSEIFALLTKNEIRL